MAEQPLLEEQRENWGSRTGFVLAAIGSAVGLGNLWGFPYKVYGHGGGAFLIPYLIAMLLVGIPVLILEFSLGHMTQRAAPDAFRGINRKAEPIGWWGILLGFIIITYYPVILAWCGSYLVESIKGIFTHGGELAWKGLDISAVENYFKHGYLQTWPDDSGVKPWALGQLVSPIAISLLVIWTLMYFCIFRGVKLVSKVVLFTVPLPWIMLFILMIRGLTLPGAGRGLNYFLDPNWTELAKPDTWRWAFGQMFFSMSLAFGVMITYASFLHRKSDLNNNATIIGLADIGTSFMAGIAVFATLGAMAFATQQLGNPKPVAEVVGEGPGLAFVAFPYALAQLPYSAWFSTVFFIALLTLGIDSAFSITESVLASLVDKTRWNRDWTLIGMSLVGLGFGLIYCTQGGVAWLGAIDDFINKPWGGIALLGLLECAVVGWAYRLKKLREHANERSDWHLGAWWDIIIRYIAPIILSTLFAWSLLDKAASPGGFLYSNTGEFQTPALVGLILAVLVPILALVLSLVRSPGANRHAQHVGQPRTGRLSGLLGTLVALVAFGFVAWTFYAVCTERLGVALFKSPWQIGSFNVPVTTILPGVGLLGAILAVFIGAAVVHHAETSEKRPSGWGRAAAGLGVMAIGSAVGTALVILLNANKNDGESSIKKTVQNIQESDALSGWSYLVLGVVVAVLVIGLGWCFYRALKAANLGDDAEQLAENMDE